MSADLGRACSIRYRYDAQAKPVDADSDRVLGVHMVGPDAGDLAQGFAVALQYQATKKQFDATIGIHPTPPEEFVSMRTPV